jgi:sugar O-acyltransferase (sialic acid O-acetyltransferase NeuD family)
MIRDVVLFGIGEIGYTLHGYLSRDPRYRLLGFTADDAFVPGDGRFLGLPVVPFSGLARVFPPSGCRLLVAVGYHDLNAAREAICDRARAQGYALESYVDPSTTIFDSVCLGDNCIVLDHVVLQPGVRLGDGACLFPGVVVAHHSQVEPYCWLASGCVVGGNSVVGARTFAGIGACIGHNIRLGRENFLGASAVVTKSTEDGAVFVVANTPRHRLNSRQFIKLTNFS